MKYFNVSRKQMLPNKNLDKFLSELQHLCKRHKMAVNGTKKSPLVVEPYNTSTVKKMFSNIQDNTSVRQDIKSAKEKEAEEFAEKARLALEKRKTL